MEDERIANVVSRVFLEEAAAIRDLDSLSFECANAIAMISSSDDPLIVSGIGKSGHIGNKLASTFCSLGKPAIFMHAAEASHGDLGLIGKNSVVLVLSNSGETLELSDLLSYCSQNSNRIIAITGRADSTLAKTAEVALVYQIEKEACRNGLAPTTSTTVSLALGDALAVGYSEMTDKTAADFRIYHPGGRLADQLKTARQIMRPKDEAPLINISASIDELLLTMTEGRLGIGILMDGDAVFGVVSDGDLRRNASNLANISIQEIATKEPISVQSSLPVSEISKIMYEAKVSQVLVFDEDLFVGVIHIHMLP